MLKYDAVYNASMKAREKMGKRADEFVSVWTDEIAKKQGRLTTADMGKMQEHKNALLAEQDYLLGIDKEAQATREYMSKNPGKLDPEWYDRAVTYWNEKGEAPPTGFASPAYRDTIDIWQKDEALPYEWELIPSGKDAAGNALYKNIKSYKKVTPEMRIQRASDMYDNDVESAKLNSYKKFDRLSSQEQKIWATQALQSGSNDPVKEFAIYEGMNNLGQDESAKGTLRGGGGGGLNFIFAGGGIHDKDNNPIVTTEDIIPTSNLGKDKGLKFTAKTPVIEPPSSIGKLMYNGQELKLAESTSLRVQPSAVLGDQIEFTIPPTETIEVIILGKRGQVPKGFERVPGTSADATGNIQWKGRVPAGSTFIAPVSDAMSYIDNNLGGQFKPTYAKYNEDYVKSHANNKYKTPISDTIYSYQELKDGGWSDADIRKLTLVK
jgi:hypothetical protein